MSHRKAVTQVLAPGSYVPPRANGGSHSQFAATNSVTGVTISSMNYVTAGAIGSL